MTGLVLHPPADDEGNTVAGLLVIEQSTTLANLLHRTLSAGGHAVVATCHSFSEAVQQIRHQRHDAVILGVPQRESAAVRVVLESLAASDRRDVPLVVIAHGHHAQLERFTSRRGHARVVTWQQFSRIPGVLAEMLPAGAEAESPERGLAVRSVRILFVDDSQSARYAYRRLLEGRGFPVETAASVGEAREQAARGRFDLIIADYYLPDGTGAELCAWLGRTRETRNAAVAIITGSYREAIIQECLDAGAVECMFKNEAKELFQTRVNSIARSIENQRSVEAERQRLDGILASVGDGVYGVDPDGVISFINATGIEILGYRDDQVLIGKSAADIIHDGSDDHAGSLRQSYARGERLSGFETVFRHLDGRAIPVECTVFPLSIRARRQGAVVVFRDISERKTVEQLRWEVTHDPVTGLANRRHFAQALEQELEGLRDEGGYSALLYINLDRFGDIIDGLGDVGAERVLREVGGKLSDRLRENDVIARLEGDQFALMLTGIQLPNVFTIADAFRSVLGETSVMVHGSERDIAGSVGVVILSRTTPSAEYALEHGRVACEMAKKRGRNQTHIYVAEEDTRTARELEAGWTERFRDALRNDRFVFLAQPIIGAARVPEEWPAGGHGRRLPAPPAGGEIVFELLLRMVGKDGQWVSPGVFVPLAERVNMAQELDLWVVRKAARLLSDYRHDDYRVCFAVNLSNVTLQDPATLNLVREAIETHAVEPERLIFEVTETAELASLHSARRLMTDLKKLGCRFALDDFGTGFSSFSHLKHLPVDFIKIDGMFVQAMTSNEVDRTMVTSITSMAHALGLATIAEHVDTAATVAAALAAGVDYVQGHFVGEPEPLDKLDLSRFTQLAEAS